MNTFLTTAEFDTWLAALRDPVAKARIALRIRSAGQGNFGDCEPVGDGISEMRIHVGAGYRVYYTRRGEVLYLLCVAVTSPARSVTSSAKALLKTLPEG